MINFGKDCSCLPFLGIPLTAGLAYFNGSKITSSIRWHGEVTVTNYSNVTVAKITNSAAQSWVHGDATAVFPGARHESECAIMETIGSQESVRILSFYYSADSSQAYGALRLLLSPWHELVMIDIPARAVQPRESPPGDLLGACSLLASEVELKAEGKPFVFLGHGLGAELAYGVARKLLEEKRAVPRAVLLSASCPPREARPQDLLSIDVPCALLIPSADPRSPPQSMVCWSEHFLCAPLVYQIAGGHFGLFEDPARSAHLIRLAITDMMDEHDLRAHFAGRPLTSV